MKKATKSILIFVSWFVLYCLAVDHASGQQIGPPEVIQPKIKISWQDNSTNEDGFTVERSIDGGEWTRIGAVETDVAEFVDESPVLGSYNNYRVNAYNAMGYSGYTNESGLQADPPLAPSTLQYEISLSFTIGVGGG